jgi:ABC-type nitrate/sulfonate/bicarbonate transport system substrate-binding protein
LYKPARGIALRSIQLKVFISTAHPRGRKVRTVRLAYRDHDRAPVIFCIKEMAERHYGVAVEVLHIENRVAFEAALFDGSCDVIIEHLEYLYAEAANGKKVTLFCAPQLYRGLQLVVPRTFHSLADLKGRKIAVRDLGRPYAITLWLKMLGLERDVQTIIVKDQEIGRWQQWRKVVTGECAACFIAPIYLPDALAAGLKTFPVPDLPVVGHYAQACLSMFALKNSELLRDYVKAVVHALCLLVYSRQAAMEIISKEPMRRMRISDSNELERQVDSIAEKLRVKPYPTAEAIKNTSEIAANEYGAAIENPLTLWDLHWLKQLDDAGFIDDLIARLAQTER